MRGGEWQGDGIVGAVHVKEASVVEAGQTLLTLTVLPSEARAGLESAWLGPRQMDPHVADPSDRGVGAVVVGGCRWIRTSTLGAALVIAHVTAAATRVVLSGMASG